MVKEPLPKCLDSPAGWRITYLSAYSESGVPSSLSTRTRINEKIDMAEHGREALGATRQEAIDALMEHFANDVLTVEEFERRVSLAHKAESLEDLRKLLTDLPSKSLPALREDPEHPLQPRVEPQVPASRVKERGYMMAALGGFSRKGRWIPARSNYAFTVLGGFELDFREALLPPGETEVWIFSLMGGAEIIVPPGLRVESDGVAILGGFDHRVDEEIQPDPTSPVLRIKGFAIMGGVEISVRYPGESSRDAKRRRKFRRKEQRRLKRGRHHRDRS
jgi:hypothetical protein